MRRLVAYAVAAFASAVPLEARADPAAAAPLCEAGWLARVYRLAHGSVGRVEVPGAVGAGFLVFDTSHVATAFHVVALGRGARVRFSNGEVIDARVVATDPENDLAILELDRPAANRAPLELADSDKVDLGTPIAAIGHPQYSPLMPSSMRGLLEWSVTQGVISAKNEAFLQTDAPLNPGNSGGPLLGCDGRVLAVVSSQLRDAQGIAFGIPSKKLAAIRDDVGRQGAYYGHFAFGDFGAGFATYLTRPDNYYGLYIGGSFIAFDRVSLTLRGGFAWGDTTSPNASTTTASHTAQFFELNAGYRFLVLAGPVPIYIVPEIGLSTSVIRRDNVHYAIDAGQIVVTDDTQHIRQVRSTVGLTVHALGLQLVYTLRPDIGAFADSTHLFALGAEL